MRRDALPLVGLSCCLALLLACFGAALFGGEQFAYRDASDFYYPLYQRVQQEWSAGRVPLWDPGQNGGAPLLGNPMAAVLYPGKVVYALLPYAWAARLYVVSHTVIALLGAVALGRSLGLSWAGSFLGGLSYAFGGQVLLQYGNVIYLVGAAWIPWGLLAIDRLLRRGKRRGMAELAAVLALQVLGGDPQAAYLVGICGAGYAAVLTRHAEGRPPRLPSWPMVAGALVVWAAGTLALAWVRPAPGWFATIPVLMLVTWTGAGLTLAWRWWRRPAESRFVPMLAHLAIAGAVAVALTGAQLLSVLELVARCRRVAEDSPNNVYLFSLEPYKVVELVWPNVLGMNWPENRSWYQAIPPSGGRMPWVASIYMGSLALILALGAAGVRGGPPWRAWLTAIAAVGLAASFGKFAGPLWWARWGPFAAVLGPHDPVFGQPRDDDFLGDGTGSPYAILAALLPGFGVFRFPSKLLTFTALGLAVLAGEGWDRLAAGEAKWTCRLSGIGLGASLLGLVVALAARARVVAYLTGRLPPDPIFGPADVAGSWSATQRALAHGAIVFAACLALAYRAPRHPRVAGALALLLLTADLAVANAGLIWTVPQDVFEETPEAALLIEAAERADPSPGPFRIHRMTTWHPDPFRERRSPDRFRELVAWERGTLRPLYGLPLGFEYCRTTGTMMEIDDYQVFYHHQMIPASARAAEALGIATGRPVSYDPRRSFDLWGARYLILPGRCDDWSSQDRGFAAFLDQTDVIAPKPPRGDEGKPGRDPRDRVEDWQLRRNRAAYPRAWVVHYARVVPPADDPDDRAELMRSLVFMDDPIWSDPDRPVFDLRSAAWVEADDRAGLRGVLGRRPVEPSEAVTVVEHGPQRVELRATLKSPGLVILADTYYPGWRLTIDGKPATIYRTNRLMRGAAVSAGTHTLIYTYEPGSFRIGVIASGAGLLALLALVGSGWRSSRLVVSPHPAEFGPKEVEIGRDLS
jgi:hypothetical protein